MEVTDCGEPDARVEVTLAEPGKPFDLVLTGLVVGNMSSKEISALIERLKVELRTAKQREKASQSAESLAAEAREKGAREEIARANKFGIDAEPAVWPLVQAGWDREHGTWKKGDRLLFLSRTGWLAGQIGQREWTPVVSVPEFIATGETQ